MADAGLDQLRSEAEAAVAGRRRGRARGAAGPLSGPQVAADPGAALDRRAAARGARPIGQAANEVRQALEALIDERDARARGSRAGAAPGRGRDRRDAARRSAAAGRPPPPRLADPPPDGGHVRRARLQRRSRAPRSSTTTTTSPPSTTRRSTPRGCPRTRSTWPRDVLLRTHTSPMQVRAMEAQGPPIYVVVPGRVYRPRHPDATHVPMFHQLEGLAIDEDITLADLQGVLLAFARADVRRGHRGPTAPGLLPVHRAERRGRRVVLPLRRHRRGAEGRCPTCKGEGWIEILGSGMVDPNVLAYVAGERLRPGAGPGLRVRDGHRAHRDARAPGPRPPHAVRERPAPAGAVRSGP